VAFVIEMLDITKTFPGIRANDRVTLQVEKGAIHALLGENGAGKSTLMSILFGLYQADSGTIKVRGQAVRITNPNIANALGIGMVHQHFKLVHTFTVTENIILGLEPRRGLSIDRKQAAQRVRELSECYGLQVDPGARIEDISVGMQQRVEILKMLYRDAEILIFDEPTAVLTPQEIRELMGILHRLVRRFLGYAELEMALLDGALRERLAGNRCENPDKICSRVLPTPPLHPRAEPSIVPDHLELLLRELCGRHGPFASAHQVVREDRGRKRRRRVVVEDDPVRRALPERGIGQSPGIREKGG